MELPLMKKAPLVMVGLTAAVHVLGIIGFTAAFVLHHIFRENQKSSFDRFITIFKYSSTYVILLHILYCIYSLCLDIPTFLYFKKEGYHEGHPETLRRHYAVKDYVEVALAFPFGLFTSIFYLSMATGEYFGWAQARYLPWYIEHLIFTNLFVFQVLETVTFPRKNPGNCASIFGMFVMYILYVGWLILIFFITELWVYPGLQEITGNLKIFIYFCIFLFLFFVILLIYAVGRFLNNLLWDHLEGYLLCPNFVSKPLHHLSRSSAVWVQKRMSRLWSTHDHPSKDKKSISSHQVEKQ